MNKIPVISIKNLSKVYRIYKQPRDLLREVLFRKKCHEEFWALRKIDLEIYKGEIVGIIGRNGVGKSTLLKILVGTLDKTGGIIKVRGKISAILELGSGFHPEYTGRENIYNGGIILGMSRKEIKDKINSIIEFSELKEFIDRPFKTYSDGMKTRLCFSLATAVDPEILVIDEALAAGDSFFMNKCIQRISNLCQSGATVLLVSHNTFLIQRFCTRVILLEKGRIKSDGEPVRVCQEYEFKVVKEVNKRLKIDNAEGSTGKKIGGTGPLKMPKVVFLDKNQKEKYAFTQGDDLTVRVYYNTTKRIVNPSIYCLFTRSDGVYSTSFLSCEAEAYHKTIKIGTLHKEGYFDIYWPGLQIGQGDYYATVGFYPEYNESESVNFPDPFVMHDKSYKISITRKGRPLQTAFDQNVSLTHTKIQ